MHQLIIEVPDQVASTFDLDNKTSSRQFLEDFLLQRYTERKISAGWLGQALGLDFYETEQFLHDRNVPPNITPEEYAHDIAAFESRQAQ